jgi:phage/plasmid-like protein (TIGR03299 family)
MNVNNTPTEITMSHQVETMAYTNEVPWHGLGFRVDQAPTVKGMLKAAKINWTVEKAPLTCGDDDVEGFYGLRRSSDGKVLDVVGSRYTPIQNEESFEFFTEFVEAGKATMETAGSLRGGRMVWGLANLNESFTLKGGDTVKGYLLVATPHEQGKSLVMKFTPVRVVCNNTITLALRRDLRGGTSEYRVHHRKVFDAAALEHAKTALGIARDQMAQFEQNARALKAKSMRREDTIEVLAGIFQPDAKVKELVSDESTLAPRMRDIMGALTNAPGADPDTAWGVLNAVTYWADHMASRTNDKRLSNAWFGRTALQKQEVLEVLLAA